MVGLVPGRQPTRRPRHRRVVAVTARDAGNRPLHARVAEPSVVGRCDPSPPASSSCLLCAEELGVDAVIVRHRGVLLAFGCFDCLRSYLAMTDSPGIAVGGCCGATAGCSPASEWCL
jgi:hypothetical protein